MSTLVVLALENLNKLTANYTIFDCQRRLAFFKPFDAFYNLYT